MEEDSLLSCTPCPSSAEERLINAYHKRELSAFKAALRSGPTPDVSVAYLRKASVDQDTAEYVKALLDADVDPNVLDKKTHKTALMLAAEENNLEALKLFLKCKRNPPNFDILPPTGDTILHLVVKKTEQLDNQERCVREILGYNNKPHFVNKKNNKGYTAVMWAAKNSDGNPRIIKALLEQDDIDLDSGKFFGSVPYRGTARDILSRYHPSLTLPPPIADKVVDVDTLIRMLSKDEKQVDEFCIKVKDGTFDLEYDNGNMTMLQLACSRGYLDAVQALLEKGASIYNTTKNNKNTPVSLAIGGGFSEILQLLIDKCDDKKTLFEISYNSNDTLLIHLVRIWDTLKESREECLDILLDQVKSNHIDLNARNRHGETALHYAAVVGDRKLILKLLKRGAYIGGENKQHRLPIAMISRDVMEEHLNECLDSRGQQFDENYEIRFDYSCLVPPGKSTCPQQMDKLNDLELGTKGKRILKDDEEDKMHETAPLLYMCNNPDLRPLLKHPIITSFLQMKWDRLAWIFRANLILFILYVIFITVHTLWGNGRSQIGNTTDTAEFSSENQKWQGWFTLVQVVATIFWLYLVAREFFQFIVAPKKYFSYSNKENYFELALICTSAYMLFSGDRSSFTQHFASTTILLCWGELILLIGRNPFLATYFEMLKRVSWNFFKFIAWYSILIIAFALSFYALFRDSDEVGNFFINPLSSLFKTIVMMTGEFDVSDIPFDKFPWFSHFVFVLFVFLIAIVLFNLLNGLAVSDTQAIKNDAELVGHDSRVRMIHNIEKMVLGQSHSCWLHCQWLVSRVTLFQESTGYIGIAKPYSTPELKLKLSRNDEEKPSQESVECGLAGDIIREAEEVIAKKNRPSDIEQLKIAVKVNEQKLTAMENMMKEILDKITKK